MALPIEISSPSVKPPPFKQNPSLENLNSSHYFRILLFFFLVGTDDPVPSNFSQISSRSHGGGELRNRELSHKLGTRVVPEPYRA
jgi:hypothetical protein